MGYAAALAASLLVVFPGCSTRAHSSQTACTKARIGGKVVCLRPGERCQARHERIYRSYGLSCRKGVLRERNFIAPPNP
jgi:hypothetical protein